MGAFQGCLSQADREDFSKSHEISQSNEGRNMIPDQVVLEPTFSSQTEQKFIRTSQSNHHEPALKRRATQKNYLTLGGSAFQQTSSFEYEPYMASKSEASKENSRNRPIGDNWEHKDDHRRIKDSNHLSPERPRGGHLLDMTFKGSNHPDAAYGLQANSEQLYSSSGAFTKMVSPFSYIPDNILDMQVPSRPTSPLLVSSELHSPNYYQPAVQIRPTGLDLGDSRTNGGAVSGYGITPEFKHSLKPLDSVPGANSHIVASAGQKSHFRPEPPSKPVDWATNCRKNLQLIETTKQFSAPGYQLVSNF